MVVIQFAITVNTKLAIRKYIVELWDFTDQPNSLMMGKGKNIKIGKNIRLNNRSDNEMIECDYCDGDYGRYFIVKSPKKSEITEQERKRMAIEENRKLQLNSKYPKIIGKKSKPKRAKIKNFARNNI